MLNSHDYFDKRVLAAVREYHELSRRRFTIVKLEAPIQRGWRRSHVLTEDARRRGDRPLLEAILEVIGSSVVHHNRDFRRRRSRRSRKLIEIEQPLRPIPVYEWPRKNYSETWRPYFRLDLVLESNRHRQPYWVFTQPSLCELRIEPNLLWYFREVDPEIEARIADLDQWLESHQGWRRYGWLKGDPWHYRWKDVPAAKTTNLRREQQREIERALALFPEVESVASARCVRFSFRRHISFHFSLRSPIGRGTPFRAEVAQVQIAAFILGVI